MRQDITAKKVLTWAGLIVIFGVVIGYGIWISHDLLFGIRQSVSGVSDGMTTTDSLLAISGRARHANDVTVDGTIVSIDQRGQWSDTVALESGYNVITIGASDKFGRTTYHSYRVYYAAPTGTATATSTPTALPDGSTTATGTQAAALTPPTATGTPSTATSTDKVQ